MSAAADSPTNNEPPLDSAEASLGAETATPTDGVGAAPPVEGDVAGQLLAVAAERDRYLEMAKRARADFENYQSRIRRDIEAERKFGGLPLVMDLLPVLDNLDRAIDASKSRPDAARIVEGLEIVRRQFLDSLSRHGIEPVRPESVPFDPNQHNAVMQQPSKDHPPMTVLYTVQAGYRFHDRVIRPAQVIVSAAAG